MFQTRQKTKEHNFISKKINKDLEEKQFMVAVWEACLKRNQNLLIEQFNYKVRDIGGSKLSTFRLFGDYFCLPIRRMCRGCDATICLVGPMVAMPLIIEIWIDTNMDL